MSFVLENKNFTQTRLRSLYSDFSSLKETNPEGYEANMQAWKTLLTTPRLPIFNNHCVLEVATLKRKLRLDIFGEPTCLKFVLKELIAEGMFMDLEKYKSRKQSIYVREWSLNGMVQWFVGVNVGSNLVSIGAVEGLASRVLKLIGDESSSVHLEQVEAGLNAELEIPVTKMDLECVMLFLSRDKGEVSISGTVVKHPAGEVTDADIAQAELRYTIWKLESQIDRTSSKILQLKRSALEYSKQGNTICAKSSLQLKKTFEKSLAHSNDLLVNATETLQNIESATINLGFVTSLKSGVSALKDLNDRFSAQDIEDMRNELDDLDEASNALNLENDEADVEAEFQKLVTEAETESGTDTELLKRLQELSISQTPDDLPVKPEVLKRKETDTHREQVSA